jgi:amino acid transporter
MNLTSSEPAPHLKRVLGLWDLVFFGIVLIRPIAPVSVFGVAQQLSHGQMVTTILIAMFAIMLTAVSYGRMASVYPSAGSAYTYVSRGLNCLRHPEPAWDTGLQHHLYRRYHCRRMLRNEL